MSCYSLLNGRTTTVNAQDKATEDSETDKAVFAQSRKEYIVRFEPPRAAGDTTGVQHKYAKPAAYNGMLHRIRPCPLPSCNSTGRRALGSVVSDGLHAT